MELVSALLGGIIIAVGLAYVVVPEKVFPFHNIAIWKKGDKVTEDWIKRARMEGIFIVIAGLLIAFLVDIMKWMYGI